MEKNEEEFEMIDMLKIDKLIELEREKLREEEYKEIEKEIEKEDLLRKIKETKEKEQVIEEKLKETKNHEYFISYYKNVKLTGMIEKKNMIEIVIESMIKVMNVFPNNKIEEDELKKLKKELVLINEEISEFKKN